MSDAPTTFFYWRVTSTEPACGGFYPVIVEGGEERYISIGRFESGVWSGHDGEITEWYPVRIPMDGATHEVPDEMGRLWKEAGVVAGHELQTNPDEVGAQAMSEFFRTLFGVDPIAMAEESDMDPPILN